MLSQAQAEVYDKFLKKFTEEILIHVKERLSEFEQQKSEENRVKQEIDTAKLKIRYSGYMKPVVQKIAPVLISPQTPRVREIGQETQVKPLVNQTQKGMIKPRVIEQSTVKFNQPQKVIIASPDEVDFGRLLVLTKDPLVNYIDCPGQNKDITIHKAGRTMKIDLTLDKQEIESIIKSFSEKTHIPLIEGMLKAIFRDIEIIAIISGDDSSFVLRKKTNPNLARNPMMNRPNLTLPYDQRQGARVIAGQIKPRTMEISEQDNKKGFFDKKITLPL